MPVTCPNDDCNFTGPMARLRNHANAKPDHDWTEIKAELTDDDEPEADEDGSDDGDEDPEEAEEGPASSEDERPEATDDQPESDPEMVSDEELQRQREQSGGSTGENSQTATTAPTGDTGRSSGQIPLPVPRSLLFALGIVAAGALLYMWVQQGDRAEPTDEQPETDPDELANFADGSGGGLMPE